MKKLLIFDFDGVVVDSLAVYEKTVRECLEKIGHPLIKTRADYLALFEDNFYVSLQKKGVDIEAFMAASVDILAGVDYDQMKPFAGLTSVLARLQAENILVIVSSSAEGDIRQAMARSEIAGCFQSVLGSDADFSKKEKILQAMDEFGMEPDNTYYIGDTTGDIKEARAVGVKTVAVTWGWHTREQLAAVKPDYLVDRPEQLLQL